MRPALPISVLALLLLPATAAAQQGGAVSPEPTPAPVETPAPTAAAALPALGYAGPAARVSRGARLTFAIRTTAPAGSVIVRISSSDRTDIDGLLAGENGEWVDETAAPTGDGLQAWSAPATSILRRRPGHYYWQAYVTGPVAGNAEQPIGPVRELVVTQPMALRGRGSLFPRFGRRGDTSFYLSSAGFPATVSGKRFQALAKTAAARWGLHALRWTSVVAGKQDGFNVAGFSSAVPDGVLGLETDYTLRGRVIEHDLALNPNQNWNDGPEYPALDQVDLESVLLHELGHMAGNRRHRKQCTNSPMIESLGSGEWWRGARDHWFAGCSSGAQAARVLVRRVVAVD